jgi:hypothetical protein
VPETAPRQPSVFENTTYTLTLVPGPGWRIVSVQHPIRQEVGDSLERVGDEPGLWHGTLNTGNDIGWFPLEITVCPRAATGPVRTDRVAWQVWPLKLDYGTDFKVMTERIEEVYPLWLFRFDTPTTHDAGKGSRRDSFLLMWFAQFDRLWCQLDRGLRTIVRSPHMTLEGQPAFLRADRLRGRLGHRLEQQVAAGRNQPNHKYGVELWRSSRDTPENRFVLHVIGQSLKGLERFLELVEGPGLSTSFRDLMGARIRSVQSFRAQPLFRGVAPFTGLKRESPVLHHRAGYSEVYRVWLELRHQLEFFATVPTGRIGMRSVNDIYEVWCFLEVRRILNDLGFTERTHRSPRWRTQGAQRELVDGMGASFTFDGPDGLAVRLSHEPTFGKTRGDGLRSYTVSQRPDIVLEADLPDSVEGPKKLIWIFDAKYRLKTAADDPDGSRDGERGGEWLVPPDALDQMHRYRDSIVLRYGEGKSRPVLSAFALYPGPTDQRQELQSNPYWAGIEEVGIGAFPLVPGRENLWLKEYLRRCFLPFSGWEPAQVLNQDSVRIPVTGLIYQEEDLLFLLAEKLTASVDLEALRQGEAQSVPLPQDFHPDRRRLSRVSWVAFVFKQPGTDIPMVHGAYHVPSGWSTAAPLALSNYLATKGPIELVWRSGPWFRYSDLRGLISDSYE